MINGRKQVLQKLINLNGDLNKLSNELKNYKWDSDEVLALVTSESMENILERTLSGQLTIKSFTLHCFTQPAWSNVKS